MFNNFANFSRPFNKFADEENIEILIYYVNKKLIAFVTKTLFEGFVNILRKKLVVRFAESLVVK